MYSDVACSLM